MLAAYHQWQCRAIVSSFSSALASRDPTLFPRASEDPSGLGFHSASAMAEKIIGSDETGNEVEMYPDPTGTITTTQELINAANTAITEANAANAIAQQTAEETERAQSGANSLQTSSTQKP